MSILGVAVCCKDIAISCSSLMYMEDRWVGRPGTQAMEESHSDMRRISLEEDTAQMTWPARENKAERVGAKQSQVPGARNVMT